ncbi:hypothetical protein FOXG_20013 [Fusarium oxysporum f. sp. lycopersici 4287]|uniref:Uncharacterized protein n=1 Tax=Fusarium oxysporum f. sp. lycopersici (strain 4287 / CBS 123668 / FGSC 9935 / NRRL 34936) TaxID=426428 RepID=A0A0J9WP28_FUSO4|nr:hypothetical protein FOXG_20013 [Fusarium oxysporum f. sp. lycopersici 4287]KNB08307.1 hypothetical protein FOXG_20013 [Fusarium oxysporum f. sp. lycopersici 4287]
MELGISQNSILTPRECLALEPNTSITMRPSMQDLRRHRHFEAFGFHTRHYSSLHYQFECESYNILYTLPDFLSYTTDVIFNPGSNTVCRTLPGGSKKTLGP